MSAKIRVMLVDDSAVIRGLFDRALKEDSMIEVVATAGNGAMAISILQRTQVDVMILDIEMPEMNGIEALPQLLKISPNTRIIMASTLTSRNADITLKAMELGASDYLAKPSTRDTTEITEFYRNLILKIKALAPRNLASRVATADAPKTHSTAASAPQMISPVPAPNVALRAAEKIRNMGALAIASSTGGPQALLTVFKEFKGIKPRVPIFITQHMPANFTAILADHITKASGLDCHEGIEGEEVKAGVIYLAPGDFHMTITRQGTPTPHINLDKNPPENFCRPSADPMLRSLAKIYNDRLMVAVLTGLGADGARGALEVVNAGGAVVSQDEATSVVYGMPKAVAEAKLTSAIMPLNAIAPFLLKAIA